MRIIEHDVLAGHPFSWYWRGWIFGLHQDIECSRSHERESLLFSHPSHGLDATQIPQFLIERLEHSFAMVDCSACLCIDTEFLTQRG